MIWALINGFLDVCLLRQSPAILPSSRALAVVTTVVFLSLSLTSEFFGGRADYFPARSLLVLGLSFLIVAGMLTIRGVSSRLTQTWTAYTGCGALVSLTLLPLSLTAPAADQQVNPLTALLILFLLLWSVVIDAHIYRHALSISFAAGLAAAFAITSALLLFIALVFP